MSFERFFNKKISFTYMDFFNGFFKIILYFNE